MSPKEADFFNSMEKAMDGMEAAQTSHIHRLRFKSQGGLSCFLSFSLLIHKLGIVMISQVSGED